MRIRRKRKEKEAKIQSKKEENEVTTEEKKNYKTLQDLKEEFSEINIFATQHLTQLKTALNLSIVKIMKFTLKIII